MTYYVGVDGGGTKTAICMANANATELFIETTSSAAWREHGIHQVVKNIKDVINSFPITKKGHIAGIALGLPCYGESEEGDRKLEKAIHDAFVSVPVYLTNDVEVGWAGSLGLKPGVNVVAGTGSIAFGKNELGRTARCGGWSEYFSDEGSCYWIGRRALQLFSRQADGRLKRDELYKIFRKELGLEDDFGIIDLVHSEYITNRYKMAALQMIARDAALAGSQSAIDLYIKAAEELCALVAGVRDSLNFKDKPYLVSYSGGLFKTGDLIIPHFYDGIEALGGKPLKPRFEPLYGAVMLAFEKLNPAGLPKLKERLNEQNGTDV